MRIFIVPQGPFDPHVSLSVMKKCTKANVKDESIIAPTLRFKNDSNVQ